MAVRWGAFMHQKTRLFAMAKMLPVLFRVALGRQEVAGFPLFLSFLSYIHQLNIVLEVKVIQWIFYR
jgi:hypothetical protein